MLNIQFLFSRHYINRIAAIKGIILTPAHLTSAQQATISLEKEWRAVEGKVVGWLFDIMNMEVPDDNISIYIFPEDITICTTNVDDKLILLSNRSSLLDYSVISICHELAHIYLNIYRKNDLIDRVEEEALAMLIADNEINKRLNSSIYFENQFTELIWHDYHKSALIIAKHVADKWSQYLNSENQDITSLFDPLHEAMRRNNISDHFDNMALKDHIK